MKKCIINCCKMLLSSFLIWILSKFSMKVQMGDREHDQVHMFVNSHDGKDVWCSDASPDTRLKVWCYLVVIIRRVMVTQLLYRKGNAIIHHGQLARTCIAATHHQVRVITRSNVFKRLVTFSKCNQTYDLNLTVFTTNKKLTKLNCIIILCLK